MTFYDANNHVIVWSHDPAKGGVFSQPRYFGEFHHLDGTVACDGEFRGQDEEATDVSGTQDEYNELARQAAERKKLEDKKAEVIMKKIAEGFDSRGHFLEKFARMFCSASETNKKCLLPAAHKLIEEYDIEKAQREKGILNDLDYQ